jgi:hypothetical protein
VVLDATDGDEISANGMWSLSLRLHAC